MTLYSLNTPQIFILFLITLGPLKLLVPFVQSTRSLDDPGVRALALRAATVASLALVIGGWIGRFQLSKWHIEVPSLMLTAGIIFFLVALKIVMQPYDTPEAPPVTPVQAPGVMQIVFPMIATPYGIATLIALLASSEDSARTLTIIGILLIIMLLNLLAMTYARTILKTIGPATLQALFAVMGVLIASLAVQIILVSLRALNIVPTI